METDKIIQSAFKFHKENNLDYAVGVHVFYKYQNNYFLLDPDANIIFSKYLNSFPYFCKIAQNEDPMSPDIKYLLFPEEIYISLFRELIIYDRQSLELYIFDKNENWNLLSRFTPSNLISKIEIMKNNLDISKSQLILAISAIYIDDKFKFNALCCDPILSKLGITEFTDSLPTLLNFGNLIMEIIPSKILLVDIPKPLTAKMTKIADGHFIPAQLVENTEPNPEINFDEYSHLHLSSPNLIQTLLINEKIDLSQFTLKPFDLMFMSFNTVKFKQCRIQTDVKYCNFCSQIVQEFDMNCPKCNGRYDDQLKPIWRFFFVPDDHSIQNVPILEATGEILDPVIGFTINDFVYLKQKINQIDWDELICKYFVGGNFLITRSFKRITSINLENKITFRVWLTQMSDEIGVDKETIDLTLLERYMEEDQ